MGIYNSPVLGQAFTNLAKMFAPPDSGDLANYALARERNGNAQRLADLFSYAQSPDFNQTTFDRLGQAGGQWTPSTGYYGVDVGAATSRANNAADNARAVEVQRMQGENELAKLYATPLKVGNNETAYIPAPAQGPMGMPPVLRGNVTLNPGEQATLPGGEVISGAPKPLSVDEVNAQNQQRLQATGQIGDQQLVDMILGKETPVQAVGPDGKTPVFMTPGAAVREGAQPYVKPDAGAKPTNALAVLNDGTRVPAIQAADGGWLVAQTGERLPDNIQIFDMPRPQGSASDVGLGKPTEASDRAGIFYSRAAPASANMDAALASGYVPSDLDYEFSLGAGSGAPNAIANRAVSDKGRQFYNNAQNFMMAVLRPDTGAAFGKEEFQAYAKVFIPLPGDDSQTIKEKALARATALAALQGTSRGAAEEIARVLQTQGLPVPPEMAAVIARGGVARGAPVAQPDGAPAPVRRVFNPVTGRIE